MQAVRGLGVQSRWNGGASFYERLKARCRDNRKAYRRNDLKGPQIFDVAGPPLFDSDALTETGANASRAE